MPRVEIAHLKAETKEMSEPSASRLEGKTGMDYVDDLANGISETEQVNDDVADQQRGGQSLKGK